MRTMFRRLILSVALSATLMMGLFAGHALASDVRPIGVSFRMGPTYLIQVPSKWNGTLVLYSHGYVVPGFSNPAVDAGDPITGAYLLGKGYALGGSSYAGDRMGGSAGVA